MIHREPALSRREASLSKHRRRQEPLCIWLRDTKDWGTETITSRVMAPLASSRNIFIHVIIQLYFYK